MMRNALEDLDRRHGRSAHLVRIVACTKTIETRVCQVFYHLSKYNSLLWYLGVQLRELDVSDFGSMQLVSIREVHSLPPGDRRCTEAQRVAENVLEDLLNSHSCIKTVDINSVIASNASLLNAVMKSPSLKRVRIQGPLNIQQEALVSLCNTIRRLNKIEQLEFRTHSTYPLHQLVISVLDLMRSGTSLTYLDVAHLQVNNLYTRLLVDMLVHNSTITSLAVGACILSSGLKGSAHKFAEYLTKENQTLKHLTLRADHFVDREGLNTVVQAIAQASVLQEVVAYLRLMEPEEMSFFAQVVDSSQTVRSLTVTRANCCERFTMTYLDELLLRTRRTNAIQPWISAIAKNTLLHKLVIDLQGFAVEECCEFFRAVAASNTLQRVIVRNITVFKDLREAFNCMNSHLLSRKVLIDDLHVRPLNIPALPECTLVTKVTLSYNHIEKGQEFRSAFSVLMKCPHVTSLSVHTLPDIYEQSLMNDIAAYIRVVPTLKNFELRFTVGHHVFASQYQRSESSLMRALGSNTNLQKLTLSLTLSKMDCHRLAIAALRIPTLSDLSLVDCGYGVSECFTPLFAQRMTSNYNLLHVELPECRMYHTENIIVQDVTRRNCGLIARALRFVLGDRDPLCASALERVCGHAKLVELVEDRAVVETTEAIAMIKRALNSIRGLQEYMTLSGVVKNSVQSLCQRDGETNLVDLNEYCWLHIRQYLTLEDVAKASNK